MRGMRSRAGSVLAALVVLALTVPAGGQTPGFQGLGQMPGAVYGTYANEVSGDGRVVVGYAWVSSQFTRAFRWSLTGGYADLGAPEGGGSEATGASFDGSAVVGHSETPGFVHNAFYWTVASGMQALPFYEFSALSEDGGTAVGMNVWWKPTGETGTFGFLGGNGYTSAFGVSADGQVAAGYSETSPSRYAHAFRWSATGGLRDLGVTTGTESIGRGVSADGQVVFGEARDKNQYWRAFRWTASTGMKDIGTTGGPMSAAYDASRDGQVLVGKSLINSLSSSERAFRWTARTGIKDLRQLLLSAGVTSVQNWILSSATGVSADGTVIVGYGLNPARQWEPFRAVLPLPR